MASEARQHADVRFPPPLIYLLPFAGGLWVRHSLPGIPLPAPLRRAAGALLLGCGAALNGWFIITMRKANTPINPTKPVRALVQEGPLRLSRNPSYLSMAVMYTGLSLLLNSLASLLLLPAVLWVVRRAIIEQEEAYLLRRFGEEYRSYQSRVRRWL